MIETTNAWNLDAVLAGYATSSSELILLLLLTPAVAGLLVTLFRKKQVAEMITDRVSFAGTGSDIGSGF